jgi:hypothetical protein
MLNRKKKTATMIFAQRFAGYGNVTESTTMTMGITIKIAIPSHIG